MAYPRREKPNRPRMHPDDYREFLQDLRGNYHTRKFTHAMCARSLGYTPKTYREKRYQARDYPEDYARSSFPDTLAEESFAHCLDVLEIALTGIINLEPYMEDQEVSLVYLKRFAALVEKLEAEKEKKNAKNAEREARRISGGTE